MPSFGNGGESSLPHSRAAFDSLSQNSSSAPALGVEVPRAELVVLGPHDGRRRRRRGAARASAVSGGHDHVLRNHSVGSRWIGASSGPRLCTVMRHDDVVGRRPWRTRPRRRSSGRRRTRRCRAARTPSRAASAARFVATRSSYGNGGLRVLVQPALVGVGRQVVDVEVVLLDVLAVVALGVGQAEEPLLEDRVVLVPQREREAQPLLVVADARRGRPRPSGRPATAPGRGVKYDHASPLSL